MRHTVRVIVASLLAMPLAATVATGPSVAASPERTKTTTQQVNANTIVVGSFPGVMGNYHQVTIGVRVSDTSTEMDGYLTSFVCKDPTTTQPWIYCEYVDANLLQSPNPVVKVGSRLTYSTLSGTLHVVNYSNETLASDVPIALRVTREGGLTTVRSMYSRTEPDGTKYRYTETSTTAFGPVTGTVAGTDVVSEDGYFVEVKATGIVVG